MRLNPPNTIGGAAIWVILLLAIVAIVYVAAMGMGVAIPVWVIHLFWIVVVAFVCIFAVRLLIGAGGDS